MKLPSTDTTHQALFEHQFWLQILGDHARFIFNGLSPKETSSIEQAQQFIQTFDALLYESRQPAETISLDSLNRRALDATLHLRAFKLDLLRRSLLGAVTASLPPTFFNHMVNELDEYWLILDALNAGKPVPLFNPVHYDLVWLLDAVGHAGSIASGLDLVEARLIHESRIFKKHFQALYLKAVEMAGYLRTQLSDFPAFRRFHLDIDLEMKLFMKFLSELEEMGLNAEVLDTISPLIPDHMGREECYYLTKLAQTSMVPSPNCDPTRPRIMN